MYKKIIYKKWRRKKWQIIHKKIMFFVQLKNWIGIKGRKFAKSMKKVFSCFFQKNPIFLSRCGMTTYCIFHPSEFSAEFKYEPHITQLGLSRAYGFHIENTLFEKVSLIFFLIIYFLFLDLIYLIHLYIIIIF